MEKIDIIKIMELLPHRYPFILVDRVIEFEPQKRIVAIKNVTINEPFFQGHFPGTPIMPGVLIIEAMAQTGGLLAFLSGNRKMDVSNTIYFMGIDKAKFRAPVTPGDQLKMEVLFIRSGTKIAQFEAKAYVQDKLVAEAILTAMLGKK